MTDNLGSRPGDDELRKMAGSNPSVSKEIFSKIPVGGGSNAKRRNAEEAEKRAEKEWEEWDREQAKKEPVEEKPKDEIVVRLSDLQWSMKEGVFNEKITARIRAEIPPEKENLTRLCFTLFAITPDGKKERIDSKDAHVKDGHAEQEFTLYYPQYREKGELPEEAGYIFTVKHKYSKEAESETLQVRKKRKPRQLYEERLRMAVTKLSSVGFGRAEGNFDSEDWELDWERNISGAKIQVLKLIEERDFADAIIKMVEQPEIWTLDCFQYVQVANLYALIDPDDKKAFEDKIKNRLVEKNSTDPKPRVLRTFASNVQRPFESTGLELKQAYLRLEKDSPWSSYPPTVGGDVDIETQVKLAPIGSRVSWKNSDPLAPVAYRVENTIKMGQDKYAAHPFGPNLARKQIETLLAQKADPKAGPAYIQKNIFISDLALFETPSR